MQQNEQSQEKRWIEMKLVYVYAPLSPIISSLICMSNGFSCRAMVVRSFAQGPLLALGSLLLLLWGWTGGAVLCVCVWG